MGSAAIGLAPLRVLNAVPSTLFSALRNSAFSIELTPEYFLASFLYPQDPCVLKQSAGAGSLEEHFGMAEPSRVAAADGG